MSNKTTEGLRDMVVQNLLMEAGEGPELGTNNRPTVNTSPGTPVDGTMVGGIAGMAGDTSPKSFPSMMFDRRFRSVLPIWMELMKRNMGL